MLTLVPQQRGGPANFAEDLGKGCEANNLVPFLVLTLLDAGIEQAEDL